MIFYRPSYPGTARKTVEILLSRECLLVPAAHNSELWCVHHSYRSNIPCIMGRVLKLASVDHRVPENACMVQIENLLFHQPSSTSTTTAT